MFNLVAGHWGEEIYSVDFHPFSPESGHEKSCALGIWCHKGKRWNFTSMSGNQGSFASNVETEVSTHSKPKEKPSLRE